MKKMLMVLIGMVLLAGVVPVYAAVLSDSQLAAITAGEQFDADINDDVSASSSAVASQKNIAVVGSTEGAVSSTAISNDNLSTLDNTGDSAVALQANIAAISGLGTTVSSDGNSITNSNTATVTNTVAGAGSADLALEGQTNSGTAGVNSMLSTVAAAQSAVATQNNIGAIVGAGGVSGGSIFNSNTAIVTNSPVV